MEVLSATSIANVAYDFYDDEEFKKGLHCRIKNNEVDHLRHTTGAENVLFREEWLDFSTKTTQNINETTYPKPKFSEDNIIASGRNNENKNGVL